MSPMEIASLLVRRAVNRTTTDRPGCGGCLRTPLPGENLHRLEDGRMLCSLCKSELPEAERTGSRPERVHADDRPLVVAPLAARTRAA